MFMHFPCHSFVSRGSSSLATYLGGEHKVALELEPLLRDELQEAFELARSLRQDAPFGARLLAERVLRTKHRLRERASVLVSARERRPSVKLAVRPLVGHRYARAIGEISEREMERKTRAAVEIGRKMRGQRSHRYHARFTRQTKDSAMRSNRTLRA